MNTCLLVFCLYNVPLADTVVQIIFPESILEHLLREDISTWIILMFKRAAIYIDYSLDNIKCKKNEMTTTVNKISNDFATITKLSQIWTIPPQIQTHSRQ